MVDTDTKPKSGKKTRQSAKIDLEKLICELQKTEFFNYVEGRELQTFIGFVDLFKRVNMFKLSLWITTQKQEIVIPWTVSIF